MIRMLGRAVTSRSATIAIDLVVIALMAVSLYELLREFIAPLHGREEAKEIIVDVTVVMIGWGVALEERGSVRDAFGVRGDADDEWQDRIDHACHGVGLMLLLFGLFAEIFEQLVALPKTVISTEPVRDVLLAIATFFVAAGLFLLVRHVIQLALMRKPR
jgi:hypothetical protein